MYLQARRRVELLPGVLPLEAGERMLMEARLGWGRAGRGVTQSGRGAAGHARQPAPPVHR